MLEFFVSWKTWFTWLSKMIIQNFRFILVKLAPPSHAFQDLVSAFQVQVENLELLRRKYGHCRSDQITIVRFPAGCAVIAVCSSLLYLPSSSLLSGWGFFILRLFFFWLSIRSPSLSECSRRFVLLFIVKKFYFGHDTSQIYCTHMSTF